MTTLSEARKRANKNWDNKNKEKKNYIVAKSQAKRFIKKFATANDLKDLEKMIEEQKKS